MQQCMELTNTNRSRAYPTSKHAMIRFGFSFQVINLYRVSFIEEFDFLVEDSTKRKLRKQRFGDDGGGVPHVPIPNTTVKPSSANGTWTAGSWESRTSPSNRKRDTIDIDRVFFVMDLLLWMSWDRCF